MAHELEDVTARMIKQQRELNSKIAELQQELAASVSRERVLEGRLEALEKQLDDAKERRDHFAMAIGEVSKQLNNVGMIVHDAMVVARATISEAKGNGPDAVEAVEKALIGDGNVQHEGKR